MSFLFVPTPQLVAKEDALPGRAEPILEPKPHAVLGTPITGPWKEGQRSLLVALGFSVDSRGSNSKPYCASSTASLQLPTLAVRHAKLLDGRYAALPTFNPAREFLKTKTRGEMLRMHFPSPRLMNTVCPIFKPPENFQLCVSKLPARFIFCCCWG